MRKFEPGAGAVRLARPLSRELDALSVDVKHLCDLGCGDNVGRDRATRHLPNASRRVPLVVALGAGLVLVDRRTRMPSAHTMPYPPVRTGELRPTTGQAALASRRSAVGARHPAAQAAARVTCAAAGGPGPVQIDRLAAWLNKLVREDSFISQ